MKRVFSVLLVMLSVAVVLAAEEQPPRTPPQAGVDQQFPPGDVQLLRLQDDNMAVSHAMEIVSGATRWQIMCSAKAGAMHFGLWAQDMMASDLVRGVVKSQGLAYRIEGNTIYIMARDELNMSFGAEKLVVQLKNAPADRVATALQQLLSSPDAKVAALPEAGSVVIYDTPASLEMLKQVVTQIDQPLVELVIQLSNSAAGDIAKTLQGFASPIGRIVAQDSGNQIVISDIAGRVATIERVCRQLDQPSQRQTKQFQLKHAECTTVAQYLADMFGLQKSISNQIVVRAASNAPQQPAGAAAPAWQPVSTLASGQGYANQPAAPPALSGAPWAVSPSGGAPSGPPAAQSAARGPAGTSSAQGAAAGAAGGQSTAGQGTVIADLRTNCVWVTDNPERLKQIAEVVAGLDIPPVTRVYKFNFADPANIKIDDRLGTVLLSPFDHWEVDPVTRCCTVTSSADKVEQAIALFKEWDVKPAQVFITGKVMTVARAKLDELGITYDFPINGMDSHMGTTLEAKGSFPLSATLPATPRGSVTIGSLAKDKFTILLENLETDSKTRILSSPRVLVVDGSKATLSVTTQEPYNEVVVSGTAQTTMQNVQFVPVGVTLNVTPRITSLGQIAMNVDIEVSSLDSFRNDVPVVSQSKMSGDVIVADGRPLVIGGLVTDQRLNQYSGVPILSRIPLIGLLFRNSHWDSSQKELVLVIVPTIVGSAPTGPAPTIGSLEKDIDKAAYLKAADGKAAADTNSAPEDAAE